MGELTTTSKPNSAHLVQAALHEAKAAVYGVGALGAGVVTMATLPLTRLATWTEYLFGKYRGGNAPMWNHYLTRACTVPTDVAARTALHLLHLRQSEHEKSETVYAPAAEWTRIFGDDAETWSMGYDVVRSECLEMKMMLPERSYVYQGALAAPMKDENGVQIVPAATMTASLLEMISRQIELLQEKWDAYVASRHTPEIIIRPAAAFVDPLPMAIQEKAAPRIIETVEEEGRWISAPPIVVPAVEQEKPAAAASMQTALVVVNAPVVTAAPAKPFLKTFTANLSTALDSKTTKLKTRIGDAVRAARARREEKRRLQAEAPLVPALKLIPVVEAPKALEAPKVVEEAKAEIEAKAEEAVIILPPPAAEEAKEEVRAEETTAEEQPFVPSFLQFDAPVAAEEKAEEAKAEEIPDFVPSFLQFDTPVAEEAKVEEVKAEEEPKAEAVAEEPAFVPSFLQFETPVIEEAKAEQAIEEAVAEAFPVEEIKSEEIKVEETKAEAAPVAAVSLDMQVTDITPAMLRQALDQKAKAAETALTALLSMQVTDITPAMLKNASPVKAAAPAAAEAAPIVLDETDVVVEAELPSFLKPVETAPVKSASIEVDTTAIKRAADAKRDAEAADMAARAAAFLFPPSVAAEISLQPALMPETAAQPKKRIGKVYNFSSNDDRTSKLPPIMSLPRGVIASHR